MTRIVITDDDTGEDLYDAPKGNDRMWRVTLVNLRRGGRKQSGTATVYRLHALFDAVAKRHRSCVKSSMKRGWPIEMRTRKAGPVVLTVENLEGLVASIASKH